MTAIKRRRKHQFSFYQKNRDNLNELAPYWRVHAWCQVIEYAVNFCLTKKSTLKNFSSKALQHARVHKVGKERAKYYQLTLPENTYDKLELLQELLGCKHLTETVRIVINLAASRIFPA
ncbi:MAG: hypothetical protein OXR68_04665 [Alphaproteobacteria bacterium]|nr:hypothetical protein [Alphaproteobacteria bacterium]